VDGHLTRAAVPAGSDVAGGLHEASAPTRMLAACPLCASPRLHYAFSQGPLRFARCSDCRLLLQNPQFGVASGSDPESKRPWRDLPDERERAWARNDLEQVGHYRGRNGGRLLELGFGGGAYAEQGASFGYEPDRSRIGDGVFARDEMDTSEGVSPVDVCVVADLIERVGDPVRFLHDLHHRLVPGGTLLLTTRSSRRGDAARQTATGLEPSRRFHFDESTLANLFYRAGYEHVLMFPRRHLSPVAPGETRPVSGAGFLVFARVAAEAARQSLSVIVPAYNEAATFEPLMERLLAKQLPGMDVDIIVVESNSNDGTRELAIKYDSHPRVELIFEDRPAGKGHAVRRALRQAKGEFILIQDADLEYDIEDYDGLLEPLLSYRACFVLGARHGGQNRWKMRRFAEAPAVSFTMNAGHWVFTTLVNVLFGLRLRDPFTMFKVFRRDCLFGLEFHCNRFDFDYELLIKLARKGYVPIEIPVNYRSRSYAEGKKVSFIRDPLTWLRALAQLRVEPLRLLENAGAVHALDTRGS